MNFVPKTDRDYIFLKHFKNCKEVCFRTFFSKLHQYIYHLEQGKKIPEKYLEAIKELYPENLK